MAKSRLAISRQQDPLLTQSDDNTVSSLDMTFELTMRGKVYGSKYNLLHWCHESCDIKKPLAKPSRLSKMQRLRSWVEQERKNQSSDGALINKLDCLKQYILYCDFKGLDPFTTTGYLAFAGNDGYLRHQVKAAINPKAYQFEYYDGEQAGYLEATASGKKIVLDLMLSMFDFDVSVLQATIKPFSGTRIDTAHKPYTATEWHDFVKRTQLFFFSLAQSLIEFKEENPDSPPPLCLENIKVNRIDGRDIVIAVGGGDIKDGPRSPFNQCMSAAYGLLAYYTAFNDSVIKDIRHPVKVVASKTESRTSKTVQVKAYKGRSSKDVQALFINDEEDKHPEASDKSAGFVVANLDKRDSVGSVNGVAFIQKLEELSKAYSNESFDVLVYFLDKEGKKSKLTITEGLRGLAQNLNLLTSQKNNLTEHLVKTYIDIVENKKMTTYTWDEQDDGSKIMRTKVVELTKGGISTKATPIAYAALSCMSDVSFRNVLMPLVYSEKNDDGEINVTFVYTDGSEGSIAVPAKYRHFFQLVESFANTRNPLPYARAPGSRGGSSSFKPPFLLPLGPRCGTYQWAEGEVPVSYRMLNECGIGYGDYFLNINSARIRVTHSDLEYSHSDNGIAAQTVLQNNPDVADKRYRNGHPASNDKQISQGLLALTHIADGKTRDEAVKLVKEDLKIPILAYEKWKSRNQPSNPNGIVCDGNIDLATEKDWHLAARKFAERHNIITKEQDITCYQYDLCVFCKSAKLVDDAYAIYKLLSFINALEEAVDFYPDRASVILQKIERFQTHLDTLPTETLTQAEELLEEQGRYSLFNSLSAVTQYL